MHNDDGAVGLPMNQGSSPELRATAQPFMAGARNAAATIGRMVTSIPTFHGLLPELDVVQVVDDKIEVDVAGSCLNHKNFGRLGGDDSECFVT